MHRHTPVISRPAAASVIGLVLIVSCVSCAAGTNSLDKKYAEQLQAGLQQDARFPFPLLPPGSLPPALPIPTIDLELDLLGLILGRLKFEDSILFGLSDLSIISDLSIDFNNTLIVNLNAITAKVDSLVLSTTHDTDFMLSYAIPDTPIAIVGHFFGSGPMNITITNLTVELDARLILVSETQLATVVTSFSLDMDELLFDAENFTIILNDLNLPPDDLLEFLKLVLPIAYPSLEPTILELLSGLLGGLFENCSLTDLLGQDRFIQSCTGLFPPQPTEMPTTTRRNTLPPTWDSATWTAQNGSILLFIMLILHTLAMGFQRNGSTDINC